MDSLSKQAKAPVGQRLYSRTRPRLSLLIVGPLLVAVTACGARSHVSVRRASPVRCPYRNPANSLSPLRLTPRQLEACRRSFKLPTPTNAAAARSGMHRCEELGGSDFDAYNGCTETYQALCVHLARGHVIPKAGPCIRPQQARGRYRIAGLPLTIKVLPGWGFTTRNDNSNYSPTAKIDSLYSHQGAAGISFMREPTLVYDPVTHRRLHLRGSFAEFIASNPLLETTGIRRIQLGPVAVEMVDARPLRNDPEAYREGFCGTTMSSAPCLPLTGDSDPQEGYVTLSVTPNTNFRAISFDTPAGRALVFIEGPKSEAQRESFLVAAMRLLSTLRFITG